MKNTAGVPQNPLIQTTNQKSEDKAMEDQNVDKSTNQVAGDNSPVTAAHHKLSKEVKSQPTCVVSPFVPMQVLTLTVKF